MIYDINVCYSASSRRARRRHSPLTWADLRRMTFWRDGKAAIFFLINTCIGVWRGRGRPCYGQMELSVLLGGYLLPLARAGYERRPAILFPWPCHLEYHCRGALFLLVSVFKSFRWLAACYCCLWVSRRLVGGGVDGDCECSTVVYLMHGHVSVSCLPGYGLKPIVIVTMCVYGCVFVGEGVCVCVCVCVCAFWGGVFMFVWVSGWLWLHDIFYLSTYIWPPQNHVILCVTYLMKS